MARKATATTAAKVGYEARLWQFANSIKAQTLATLREMLLPKLISRELRVIASETAHA